MSNSKSLQKSFLIGLGVFIGFYVLWNISTPSTSSQKTTLIGSADKESSHNAHSNTQEEYPFPVYVQDHALDHRIVLTREYSFKLNKTSLLPRTQRVGDLFVLIKHVAGLNFMENGKENLDGVISVRSEAAALKFGQCKYTADKAFIRVREYLKGDRKGYTTVDIKGNYLRETGTPPNFDKIYQLVDLPYNAGPEFVEHEVIDKLEEG